MLEIEKIKLEFLNKLIMLRETWEYVWKKLDPANR